MPIRPPSHHRFLFRFQFPSGAREQLVPFPSCLPRLLAILDFQRMGLPASVSWQTRLGPQPPVVPAPTAVNQRRISQSFFKMSKTSSCALDLTRGWDAGKTIAGAERGGEL